MGSAPSSPPSPGPLAFSICIPAYNCRPFLAETLASVRGQTHPHWEVIVAEDGSPAPARDIVEAFAASVPQRVVYVASPANRGTAAARDLAMAQATQPLVAVLDGDDLWTPDHLATLARCFADEACEFAFGGFTMFYPEPGRAPDTIVPAPAALADLRAAYYFGRVHLPTGALAFRRRLLERTGPWADGIDRKPAWLSNRNYSEDRNFLLRLIRAGVTPVYTGAITFAYRKHAGSVTGFASHGVVDRAWFYNDCGLLPGLPRGAQRRYLGYINRLAGDHLRANQPRRAAYFYFRAWRWHPGRVDRLAAATLAGLRALVRR